MSPAEFLRIGNLRKSGITRSAKWFASAENARTAAQRIGPFRFAPVHVHELTTLRVIVELDAPTSSVGDALNRTLVRIASSFGVGSQVSKLAATDLRVLVVSPQKEPLALLTADSAIWDGGRGNVRLQNVLWREPERADLRSRAVRLDPGGMNLLADSWLESGAATCSSPDSSTY
jgi:hypothetical protein